MSAPAPSPAGDAPAAAPRAAATLVLLRDARDGVEAFMLKRHADDSVLADAYVFPGGKVDAADASDALLARFGVAAPALHARLAEPELDPQAAAAVFAAAVRETFEETGVLLATDADAPLAERAYAMLREGIDFAGILERLGLRLDASLLEPWSRWVTPPIPSLIRRRFDTRFFVARLPAGQSALHDLRESVGGEWLAPRAALEAYWAQRIVLAAPQIMTLAHVARFADVDAVLAEARRRPPPVIRPEPRQVGETRLLLYPGDPEHPVRERAMPGPTRMLFENGRFRPERGFDAWFD